VKRLVALSWLLTALAPLSAAAQLSQVHAPVGDTAADYRFQVGPVGLAPTLQVDNLGVDSNAKLSAEDPVQDFTVRATPGAAYLLRMRHLRLHGNTAVSFLYYQKTAEQRSIDMLNSAALTYMGSRFEPRVFGSYGHQQTRPNLEIETIVGQLTQGYGVGADYRLSPRLVFQVDADRLRQEYEERVFRGALLNRQLNRDSNSIRGRLRISTSSITTLILSAIDTRDRFQYSAERDAASLTMSFGMETKPSALIAGSASVGYRRFNALSETVPDDRGPVADVAVSYTLRDRTRFGVNVRRNLEFSAEREQPYYILTGLGGSITQMIGLGWDVRVGGGGDTLAYKNFVLGIPGEDGRTDHIDTFNFGFGRKMGDVGRVGLEVGHVERRSPIKTFSYDGWRAGVKITYGT
jgi:hypothetical protein